jgi:hypothetical protein
MEKTETGFTGWTRYFFFFVLPALGEKAKEGLAPDNALEA